MGYFNIPSKSSYFRPAPAPSRGGGPTVPGSKTGTGSSSWGRGSMGASGGGSNGGGGYSAPQPAQPAPPQSYPGAKAIRNSVTGIVTYSSTAGQKFDTYQAAQAASQRIANPTAFNPNLSDYYTSTAQATREDVNKLNPNYKKTYAVFNPVTNTVFTTTNDPTWKGVPYAYNDNQLRIATPEQIAEAYAAGRSTGITEKTTKKVEDAGYEYYETDPIYGTYLDEAEYQTKREALIGKVYGDIFAQEQSLIDRKLGKIQGQNLKKQKYLGAISGPKTLSRKKKSRFEIAQRREIGSANSRIENLRQALYGEAIASAPNKQIIESANKEMDALKKNATKYGIVTPSRTAQRKATQTVTSKNYLF